MPNGVRDLGQTSIRGAILTTQSQVELQCNDRSGSLFQLTMDLPNAMFLMNMLTQIQRETRAKVPVSPPDLPD
ncbi:MULTISPECIES: hypothetical protein [unclassified Bosea (in: a-proteobacteria)]|uniref:hypothetical protein n=1 Tax=unclassified Bosea (in: a-proteobacteria) TaxID=2653178 RepID=UPI000F7EF904|nr:MULTISPECIES: hypothetical protein [unclassified Bosea (in: a-proteobacteria)]